MAENPFSHPSTLPYQLPPFDRVSNADYRPGFDAGMREQRAEVQQIVDNPAEPDFQNTMGLFLNLVPFRTDISRCANFREIVARTRDTCIDAYAHEVPISVIEQDLPEFNTPHDDPGNSQIVLGMYQAQSDGATLPIADGADPIIRRTVASSETSDIPSGMAWSMAISSSGEMVGNVVYNLDEFDESTVTGWVSHYNRILSRLVREPDREWRQLADVAS